MDLESELVFVGDEGTAESRSASRRLGTEASMRLTSMDWLILRGNLTYTDAEFRDTGDAFHLLRNSPPFPPTPNRVFWDNSDLSQRPESYRHGLATGSIFYRSRLPGEPIRGMADIHLVPGTPRMVMGGVTWTWGN